ncbi:glycosyltransferase family 2 protein [Lutibacter citreus]|uniref:glycosyltransferase family 2 protein n=1 Tax=Lutibacter citreus TaxID=2138210 RepID=UPI000DBE26D2|nr:glycosyltransferase family 2 protein [Lutibacter citreus]
MISIIIPVYNAATKIAECIESVLVQTYNNYEIIIVNDGSIDNSIEIIKSFTNKHHNIVLINQNNQGVTSARKNGFLASNGDYIMFLDSDDKLKPNCLAILLSYFDNSVDLVNGSVIGIPDSRIWLHKDLGILNKKKYIESILKGNTYAFIYASLYKRKVINNSIFNIDKSIKIGEDVLIKLFMSKNIINNVCNIKDIVYEYINTDGSVMNNKIVHPIYIERYYALKSNFFENELHSCSDILFKNKISAQLRSFFSPWIKFDDEYYPKLREDLNTKNYSFNFTGRNRILALAARYKFLAKITKGFFYYIFIFKNSIKRNTVIEKEILY